VIRQQIRTILHGFFPRDRLQFDFPLDGEGWLVVLIRKSLNLDLRLVIEERIDSLTLEASAAGKQFREHCLLLLDAIRAARHLDRLDIEQLYVSAREAHRILDQIGVRNDRGQVEISLRAYTAGELAVQVPDAPNRPRMGADLIDVSFTVELVGIDCALVLLEQTTRALLGVRKARTRLYWESLGHADNQSTILHRKMLAHCTVNATCRDIRTGKGELSGLSLEMLMN